MYRLWWGLLVVLGALLLLPGVAGAATTTCGIPTPTQVLGSQITATTSSPASGAQLPFTGYSPHLFEVGVAMLAIGTIGRAAAPRWGRSLRLAGPALLVVGLALGSGINGPSVAAADTCSPGDPALTPPAVVPEIPFPVLLPISGAATVLIVLRRRARRNTHLVS